jgi:hypothetical protein
MKTNLLITVAAILALAAPAVAVSQDDSFRCGSVIVSVGMSQDAVLQSCGEPASKVVEQVAVREGAQYAGTAPVEHWTYTSGAITRVLTFDQGKLVSIDMQ